jgi:hypothetical protein
LGEGPKFLVGIKSTRGAISKELGLYIEPEGAGRGTALRDDVSEGIRKCGKKPSADNGIHANPIRWLRKNRIGEDVALQGKFGEGEKERFTPAGVEGGVGVKE